MLVRCLDYGTGGVSWPLTIGEVKVSKVNPDEIYRYLHNELPADYPVFLKQESAVKEPVYHPGSAPKEETRDFIQVDREAFFDTVVGLSKIRGINLKFEITYHPFVAATTAPCNDYDCSCRHEDNHMVSYPEHKECFSISYVVNDPEYRNNLRNWEERIRAHNDSLDSRRRKIESNKQIANENRKITDDARNKNIEIWRFVAKELNQGHVPDLKEYKRAMLIRQLEELG